MLERRRNRKLTPLEKEKHAKLTKAAVLKNPEKKRATSAVSNAVRDGRLTKPCVCEHCGSSEKIQAHHSSYAKEMWLVVTWLCSRCHGAVHRVYDDNGLL